jgi:hypothetical protein
MTRVPEVWLGAEEGPLGAYVELVDLEQGTDSTTGPRVQIPAPGRRCVEWLTDGEKCEALSEIADPGCVRLLPWDRYGARLISRIKALQESGEDESSNELLYLTERFRRIHVEKNGRFPVHSREQFHLGLNQQTGWRVLLVCVPDRVELWSETFRRQWRGTHSVQLPWD